MNMHKHRNDLQNALLYTYGRLNTNTSKILETAAAVDALVQLLCDSGAIDQKVLQVRQKAEEERLSKAFRDKGMGVVLQEPEYDKYAYESNVEIDCEKRIPHCKAACCRLPFALSAQDIREGVVQWELSRPYMIEQGADGYCNHLGRDTQGCTIYDQRPVPCRAFNCRNDKRIWEDFDNYVPNPAINRPDWIELLAQEKEAASLPVQTAEAMAAPEPAGEALAVMWRHLITDADKPWVLFQHGTVVIMTEPPGELAEVARSIMAQWGPTPADASLEDFSVFDLGEQVPGWVVTRHFVPGFDMLTYVSPTELAEADPPAEIVRQVGCDKRQRDVREKVIVHIEDQRPSLSVAD